MAVHTSAHTPSKQEALEDFVRVYFTVGQHITAKHAYAVKDLLVLDYFAGDGRPEGSPAIFERMLHRLVVPHRLVAFERNRTAARRLKDALAAVCPIARVFPGSCQERIDDALLELPALLTEKQFGLIYIDPNNGHIPVAAVQAVLRRRGYDRMDVLIHAATRVARRLHGAGVARVGLDAAVAALGKRCVLVRPFGPSNHDWAFVIATNWPNPAQMKGYVDIKTPEGAARWARLTLTHKEREARQQRPLFPTVEEV